MSADTTIAVILIALGIVGAVFYYADLTNPLPTKNAAPAPVLDPPVPARATCARTGHAMRLSDLGTWWFCGNDDCNEMWPADQSHRLDLPYDREAAQLVDEVERHLRSVS